MSDILAAVAAILVVLFLFLGIVHESTTRYTKQNGRHPRFCVLLWTRQVPLLIFSMALWYALLPAFVRTFASMKWVIWDFDTASAIFMLIELGATTVLITVIYFIIWSIWKRSKGKSEL